MKAFRIGNRKIGGDSSCFIVAEISCNHLQKKNYALKLIEEAKAAGADAQNFASKKIFEKIALKEKYSYYECDL